MRVLLLALLLAPAARASSDMNQPGTGPGTAVVTSTLTISGAGTACFTAGSFYINCASGSFGASSATISGGLLLNFNGNNRVTIGFQVSGGATGQLSFLSSNSQINWDISHNRHILGALEFVPSTSGGGSTFSTPAMILDSGGNLGLGTTAPTSSGGFKTLAISGSTGGQLDFQTAGVSKQYIYSSATDLTYYNANGGHRFYNGTEQFYVGTTGNSGFGTNAPSTKLQIVGGLQISSAAYSAPTYGAGIEIRYANDTLTGSPAGYIFSFDRSAGLYKDLFFSANSFGFSVGNVGIGTQSPLTRNHIYSGSGAAIVSAASDAAGGAALFEGTEAAINTGIVSVISNDDSIVANAGGKIAFGAKYSGSAFAHQAAIKSGRDDATSGNYGGYLELFTRANGGSMSAKVRVSSAGLTRPYVRTKAQINAITPTTDELGGIIICSDCTVPYSVCTATGTTLSGFRRADSTTAGCGTNN